MVDSHEIDPLRLVDAVAVARDVLTLYPAGCTARLA